MNLKLTKDFDIKKKINFLDFDEIEYGIVKGNGTILFVKAGQDGSIYGYKNKYLNMAKNINKKYGISVICSSNPYIGLNPLNHDLKVVDEYARNEKFNDYKIYYMGTSNCAFIGCYFGMKYQQIKRILFINMPLDITTIKKLKNKIPKFFGEKLTFVYGTLDESYLMIDEIKEFQNDKIQFEFYSDQDHYFLKNNFLLDELPEKYLLN